MSVFRRDWNYKTVPQKRKCCASFFGFILTNLTRFTFFLSFLNFLGEITLKFSKEIISNPLTWMNLEWSEKKISNSCHLKFTLKTFSSFPESLFFWPFIYLLNITLLPSHTTLFFLPFSFLRKVPLLSFQSSSSMCIQHWSWSQVMCSIIYWNHTSKWEEQVFFCEIPMSNIYLT